MDSVEIICKRKPDAVDVIRKDNEYINIIIVKTIEMKILKSSNYGPLCWV